MPTKEQPIKAPLPFLWNPGQHMSIIGMTGSGKSVLAASLLGRRKHYLVLRSKADETTFPGAVTAATAARMDDDRVSRLVLHPRFQRQQAEFATALDKVWRQGGWTCLIDETHYVDTELKLRPLINRLLTQGRSPGYISMICGMQRPTGTTRFAIGESTHVISFGLEGRDAKILEQASSPALGKVVTDLGVHELAWYAVPYRKIWRGKLDMKSNAFVGEYL